MPTVTSLLVAPVKALAAVPREEVLLGPDGVAEDRRLLLLRDDGSVVTQRRYPSLARVVPDLDLAAGTVSVALPGGTTATSSLEDLGEQVTARLFGKDRTGRVVPGAVAAALSDHVGEPVRLVLAGRTGVGWDEGPVSLVGRASMDAVGTPEGPDGGPRYRMLVEVDGDRPYAEDAWVGSRLRLGAATVRVTHPLGRCVVIEHDPATGEGDWDGVRALVALRGATTLGVIAEVVEPGRVRVGDPVEPLG